MGAGQTQPSSQSVRDCPTIRSSARRSVSPKVDFAIPAAGAISSCVQSRGVS